MSDINIKINVVSKSAEAAVSNLAKDAATAEKNFKGLNVRIRQGSRFLSSFAGNLAAIGVSKAIGAVTQGFSTLTSTVFESTKALEVAATQFEVLTGSAAEANEIIRDLQEFTARTPFRFESVSAAAQRLLSFGFTTEEVKTNLEDLGDVAAASGADIGELSLIYGQVAAAGKLTGERLLQLQERAIPIGPALAKSLGVAESSVRDLVSQGRVDLATFEEAFQSLNEEGNFAFGGIEKASQTLEGRLSTLSDNFELFAAGIGERLSPALKAGTTALTEFIQQLGSDQGFNNFLDNVANAIPGAVRFLGNTIIGAIEVFNAFRVAANAIVGSLFLVVSGSLQAAEAVLTVASAAARFTGIDTSGIDSARDSITALKDAAAETASDIAEDNRQINQSTEELTATINRGADTLIRRYNEEREAATAKSAAVVQANQQEQESFVEKLTLQQLAQQEFDEAEAERKDALILLDQERDNAQLEFLKENLGQQEAARIAFQAKQLQDQGKTEAALKVLRDGRVKAEQAAAKREAEIDKKRQQDKANFFGNLTTIARIGNRSLFETTKRVQTGVAIIDGLTAIQKAASALPFPANIPGIVAETARSIATVSQIKSQSFQDGGVVDGNSFSGDNVVARVNSGEMILNRQQQATLFNLANGQGGGSGQVIEVTSVVQIDETEIGRAVSRQVADGLELGEGGV